MPVSRRQVNSLSKSGSAKLKGDVTLSQGSNVTITQSGQDIQIAASGGSGSGDVTGAASSTDNAIVLFNGTGGKTIKNSDLTVSGSVLTPSSGSLEVNGGIEVGTDIIVSGDVLVSGGVATNTILEKTAASGVTIDGVLLKDGTVDGLDVGAVTATPAELNILDGATLTTTELNYVDGVTSAIQTQIDSKASSSDLTTHMSDTTTHGTTGDIVGTSDSQTLTNKTISGSSNTLSNIAQTSISNSTSHALGTGTIELGHASDTTLSRAAAGRLAVEGVNVPTISSTDTLTNKTIALGSNTVSGTTAQFNTALTDGDFATLAGSETLTNKTIAAGSNTITGLTNTNLSTTAGALGGAWTSWTPTWTNLTTGNGTLNYAKYMQIGKTVSLRLKFTLGTTSSVGAAPTFSLPVTPHGDYGAFTTEGIVSSGMARDVSLPGSFPIWAGITSGAGTLYVSSAASTYVGTVATLSSTVPFTFASTDIITVAMQYEAA